MATTSASARALDRPRIARVRARTGGLALPLYAATFLLAEAIVAAGESTAAAIVDGLLLFVLINHYAITAPERGVRRRGTALDALPVLALLPLMRIVSLALPLGRLPVASRYVAIGGSFLLAAALTGRLIGLHRTELGLRVDSWRRQLRIALFGLPLGLLAYLIAQPDPLTRSTSPAQLAVQVVVLVLLVAFVEELVFRGMLRATLAGVGGLSGVAWSSLLFAGAYLGTRDPAFIPFIAVVGLFFGACAKRTGSIVGVSAAHGLLLAGLLVIWPHALGSETPARHHQRPTIFQVTSGTDATLREPHQRLAVPAAPAKKAPAKHRKRHKQRSKPAVRHAAAPPAVTPTQAPTTTSTPAPPRTTTPTQRVTAPPVTKTKPKTKPNSGGSFDTGGSFDDSG